MSIVLSSNMEVCFLWKNLKVNDTSQQVFYLNLEGGIPTLGTWGLGSQTESSEKKVKCYCSFLEPNRSSGFPLCITNNSVKIMSEFKSICF